MRRQRILTSNYTGWIIGINVVFFILALILGFNLLQPCELSVCKDIALQPATIIEGQGIWTLLTSMFMHAGLGHLFVNMISLLFIGSFVEKLIGKKRYLSLYLISGLFAGLFFVAVSAWTNDLNIYAVGASGAIFALGGLLAILTPRLPVLVFFIIPMPMWIAIIALMVILWVASIRLGLPIGNIAHLGGLIVGVGYGLYLKKKYPRKTQAISRHFSR